MRLWLTTLVVGILVAGTSAGAAFAQDANAHWYNKDAQTGKFSVILNVPDGTDAILAVAREKGISTTVMAIGTDLTFQRKVLSCDAPLQCFPPSVLIGIDKDMNGRYEADDFAWQWSLASGSPDPALLHGDTFIQCENTASLAGTDASWMFVDVHSTYACFSPNLAGTGYDLLFPYFPGNFAVYQTTGAPFSGITPLSGVLALKVLAGGSPSWMNFSSLVDKVTMGGSTRVDEPNNSRSHFEHVTSK